MGWDSPLPLPLKLVLQLERACHTSFWSVTSEKETQGAVPRALKPVVGTRGREARLVPSSCRLQPQVGTPHQLPKESSAQAC